MFCSSQLYTSAASSYELLDELQQLDSRTIYIEEDITVPNGEWPMTQVISNYRSAEALMRSALMLLIVTVNIADRLPDIASLAGFRGLASCSF